MCRFGFLPCYVVLLCCCVIHVSIPKQIPINCILYIVEMAIINLNFNLNLNVSLRHYSRPTGDFPAPRAVLTGHDHELVCVAVCAELGLVISGAKGRG